ncbi:hypothetical protein H1D32_22170 [Anaerobacillus sp. CMMVII]|uniref:hypothetical protein n=1 Tax=Anaerobacillus sp. CMMVII TaxID=2755588 RepID=UPI0021B7F406|nr:hypothetical protein [Anaerobacillus sp. CMMVII]MCT8140163.1 hypothetical protein [Anaerobacillus sp. CMMVII]
MKTTLIAKRRKQPVDLYQFEILALNKKYEELKRKMEEQHLENIHSDEMLLKYLRNQ